MNNLINEIYIDLLNLYIADLENELWMKKIAEDFNIAIEKHFEQFPVPVVPMQPGPRSCPTCGISLDGVLSYCCPNPRCPTGLGSVFID